jgi:hypothetical protein
LPWLELSFFFELEDSPRVGDSIPSQATSAPQQIPWLNVLPRRTKVFSLVKLRLQIGEALGISVSDGIESRFGGTAQEAQAMGYFRAYGDC